MRIVSIGDNRYEMSNPFSGKNKEKIKMSSDATLNFTWSAVYWVKHGEPFSCFRFVALEPEVDMIRGRFKAPRGRLTTVSTNKWRQPVTTIVDLVETNQPQHEKMYLLTCAPNEDSNQPAQPRSMIRVVVVRMKNICLLDSPKFAQWSFWSDCVNVQFDLNLRWAHMSKGTFSDVAT